VFCTDVITLANRCSLLMQWLDVWQEWPVMSPEDSSVALLALPGSQPIRYEQK